MKKRISQKEWEYLGKYNYAAKWARPFCSYSIEKIDDNEYHRNCDIGWFLYLVLFIPVHLLQALCCMWDGGLKEFEICPRHLGHDYFHEDWGCNQPAFPKAKEIWEKHN